MANKSPLNKGKTAVPTKAMAPAEPQAARLDDSERAASENVAEPSSAPRTFRPDTWSGPDQAERDKWERSGARDATEDLLGVFLGGDADKLLPSDKMTLIGYVQHCLEYSESPRSTEAHIKNDLDPPYFMSGFSNAFAGFIFRFWYNSILEEVIKDKDKITFAKFKPFLKRGSSANNKSGKSHGNVTTIGASRLANTAPGAEKDFVPVPRKKSGKTRKETPSALLLDARREISDDARIATTDKEQNDAEREVPPSLRARGYKKRPEMSAEVLQAKRSIVNRYEYLVAQGESVSPKDKAFAEETRREVRAQDARRRRKARAIADLTKA